MHQRLQLFDVFEGLRREQPRPGHRVAGGDVRADLWPADATDRSLDQVGVIRQVGNAQQGRIRGGFGQHASRGQHLRQALISRLSMQLGR